MKRLVTFLALPLVVALLGAACGGDEPTDELSVDSVPAERIVSITPTGTEMLYAVGAGDLVVAVDEFSYYPEGTPVTDLSGWDPNIEAILSYEPDLVVMDWNDDLRSGLEAAGVSVLVIAAPSAIEEVYTQIQLVGDATGFATEATVVVDAMRTAIDGLVDDAPQSSALTYYHELDNTLYSVTSSTFIGAVYALFGLTNVADTADADGAAFGYPQLSDEYLLDADPDVIFLADTRCCAQSAETVAARPGWDQLTAVQNGNVVELDDDVVSRWGPRLVEFVEAIAAAIESAHAD
ncbi:MAG: ABC transporter substrate-binding protein [Acidimicrobiales bacterium]